MRFWLHGSTPGLNDGCWGIQGLYRRTIEIIGNCHEVQLPVQINTIVSRRNFQDMDPMIELLTRLDVGLWNVFFFVPGSARKRAKCSPRTSTKQIFAKLYNALEAREFPDQDTEGQHYQRYLLQQRVRESRGRFIEEDCHSICAARRERRPWICLHQLIEARCIPAGSCRFPAGNVMPQSLSEMYWRVAVVRVASRRSKLKGKCGRCPVRTVCGGSRARAYAVTGDLFAADPCCAYEP